MKIFGHVDLCGPELIEGWLYCDAWDDQPIKLQVFVGNELLGECDADRYRNDLQEAGYGDGRCGFSFPVPGSLLSSDFAQTKLRLVKTPVFLLPDEFSNVSKSNSVSESELTGSSINSPDHSPASQTEIMHNEAKVSFGKGHSPSRPVYRST